MKIKIVEGGEGNNFGARVVDENGKDLENKITEIEWTSSPGNHAETRITFIDMEFEIKEILNG